MKSVEDIANRTKSLEDIIIDIAEWVKEHGPIKRKFPPSSVNRIIEQSRALTMLKGLTPPAATGWQILHREDVLIAFAGWRTPEGKATLYQPDIQAVTAVFNLISKGASIGDAVDAFMLNEETPLGPA